MINKYITDGKISIGVEDFPDIRKKPCLCVREKNTVTVIGTLRNEDCAEFFIEKLQELTNAKEVAE